jgi:hypothetical protein
MYEVRVHVFSTVIPGPNNPGRNIDICLQSLIDDISRKQNFLMRTTLIWTINDFKLMEWFLVRARMEN